MLLKVGVAMMAFALAFAAVTAGVVVVLRDQPESAIAAKPAAKAAMEPPFESLPTAKPTAKPSSSVEPLVRSNAPVKPRVEKAEPKLEPEPQPGPNPQPQPKAKPKPAPEPERNILPVAEDDWQAPTNEELQVVNGPRHYKLPPYAIMGLTIRAIGLYNVPVINSDSQRAFARGVVHEPETSLPWSNTPQRNVYLAAHAIGNYGTNSRLVFFKLDELQEGDTIMLQDRSGGAYSYRVSEVFVVDPTDTWVMGQVRGRDMVTLQTCTPYPSYEKRLIVRADRL